MKIYEGGPLNTQPIKAITKIPDFKLKNKQVQEAFTAFMRLTHQEVSGMAVDALKSSIALKGAVATGTLLDSVYRRFLPKQSGLGGFVSNVGFKKPGSAYAFFANYGRAAGEKPPFAAIEKWAIAIGNNDPKFIFAVINKIASEGTEGHFFVEDAEKKIEALKPFIVAKNMEQFARSIK